MSGLQSYSSVLCERGMPPCLCINLRTDSLSRSRRAPIRRKTHASSSAQPASVAEPEADVGSSNPAFYKSEADELAAWIQDTYGIKKRADVQVKVERALAARQALAASHLAGDDQLSLHEDLQIKAQVLDQLSPGLGWKVFCRYPEEFAHPDALDLWRIMAAILYTTGFQPQAISSLFHRHPSLFARTVQDPGNLKALFEWFQHLGLDEGSVVRIINKHPLVLQTSVDGKLKPRLAYLEELGVPRAAAVAAIRRVPEILGIESAVLQEKVDYLMEQGLSRGEVAKVVAGQPSVLCSRVDEKLDPVVRALRDDLGCTGELLRRMIATSGLLTRSPSTIRSRAQLWTELGLAPELLRAALRRFPRLLLYPIEDAKYLRKVEFLTEEVELPVTALAAFPQFVSYSLAKRLAPRCAAAKALRGRPPTVSEFALKEEAFLQALALSSEEYEAFLKEWKESDAAKKWLDSPD